METDPIDEESTRLIIRLKCHYRWARPTIVSDLILMEICDFPMMRKLMLGIKQRAEQNREQITEQGPLLTYREPAIHPRLLRAGMNG